MKRGTPDHPKTVMLTVQLEKIYAAHHKKAAFGGKLEAVGILELLWDWASKYAIQGDIGKWPDEAIAAGIGWAFAPNELISALIASRWIDRAPEPHRLVIHDIKDHATNCWRQNLENAGLTWWDGSDPRKYKLQKSQKKLQEKSNVPPQPEPKPESKPEPETNTPVAPQGGHRSPRKRKSGKRTTEEIRSALGDERLPWWDGFWGVYPCHDGINPAMDAYERKVHDRGLAVEIYKGAERYAAYIAAKRKVDPSTSVKYAQGWLNDERWRDESAIPDAVPAIRRQRSFVDDVEDVMGRNLQETGKVW